MSNLVFPHKTSNKKSRKSNKKASNNFLKKTIPKNRKSKTLLIKLLKLKRKSLNNPKEKKLRNKKNSGSKSYKIRKNNNKNNMTTQLSNSPIRKNLQRVKRKNKRKNRNNKKLKIKSFRIKSKLRLLPKLNTLNRKNS